MRAGAHRRAGGGRAPLPGLDRDLVPEPRRRRATPTPRSTSRSRRCAATPPRAPARYGLYFETRPGRRRHQRPRQGLRHGDPRVAQVRLRARAEARGGGGAGARRPAGRAVGPPQRRGRLHRPRGVPHPRAAGALLPRGHRDGQAARADHRPRRLLDAPHGGRSRRPRLVPRPHHAGEPRLPDGAADQERPDAQLPHHRVPGPRADPRAVRLQGGRPDVGVLPGAGRDRRRRTADRALRAPDAGSTSSTGGARAMRAPTRRSSPRRSRRWRRVRERGVELAVGHGERALGPRARARSQDPPPLRRLEAVHLGRAARRLRRRAARRGRGAHAVERPHRLHPPPADRREARRARRRRGRDACAIAARGRAGTCSS